jgi:DNA modification methylase
MPNKNTFSIKPIKELIKKYNNPNLLSVDPFANNSKLAKITNDLDISYDTTHHLDALIFLDIFENESIDLILNDPPYNFNQLKQCYNIQKESKNLNDNYDYWFQIFKKYHEKLKKNGKIITFSWNSSGINMSNNLEIIEVLFVPHGGIHYDTVCVVENKLF